VYVNLHTVIINIPRCNKCTDVAVLCLVFLQLQEIMVQGAVEVVVDMEGGAVIEFLQACHG